MSKVKMPAPLPAAKPKKKIEKTREVPEVVASPPAAPPAASRAVYQEALEELSAACLGIEYELSQTPYFSHPEFTGTAEVLRVMQQNLAELQNDVYADAIAARHEVTLPVLSKLGYVNHLLALHRRLSLVQAATDRARKLRPQDENIPAMQHDCERLLKIEVQKALEVYPSLDVPEVLRKYRPRKEAADGQEEKETA